MEDEIKWVKCELGYDPKTEKVKLKAENKEDFAMATGLLLRISLDTTKGILMDEAKKDETKGEK